MWTMCYRWGKRPAYDPERPVLSPNGRWAVDLSYLGETIVFDARSGRAVARVRHAGRAQDVAFEDSAHYLVVLTHEPHPDAWPDQWIARCDMQGQCERTTPVIVVRSYDMLRLRHRAP